jgi:PncC family amidohydrolase
LISVAAANEVARLLIARRATIGAAESSAGGLISAALLAVPGASAYFVGGVVVYTGPARERLLGIEPASMEAIRSSSEPYAQLLARTVRERLGTTWGIAETGAAGPTGNRYGDPAGHTCVAVAGPVERSLTIRTSSADREANMAAFTEAALHLLMDCLNLE